MMMHSLKDEIIPIQQARLLYNKYIKKHGNQDIEFLEVEQIQHNSFHRYIAAKQVNDLQKEILGFLDRSKDKINKERDSQNTSSSDNALTILRNKLKYHQFEDDYFEEEDFEMMETESPSSTRKANSNQEWNICGMR